MTKKLLTFLTVICLLIGTLSGISAFAAPAEEKWTANGAELTALTPNEKLPYSVRAKDFAQDSEWSMQYGVPVNAKEGFEIVYMSTKTGFEKEAPYDNNYVEISLMQDKNNGMIFRSYARFSKEDSDIRKMITYVRFVKDGAVTTTESFETMTPLLNNKHIFSAKFEGGQYWFTFDGTAAIPSAQYNSMDLSAADVTVKVKSSVVGDIRFSNPRATEQSVLFGDWSTLGATDVKENADGTMNFQFKDPISDTSSGYNDGANRLRDNLVYYNGVDVRQPIVIEASYDIKAAPSVWWGFALAVDPYECMNKTLFSEETGKMDDVIRPGSTPIDNGGVMIQTGTGNAQNGQKDLQADLKPYTTNSGIMGYEGRQNLDTIEYRVGEQFTSVYFNGELLWDTIALKQSDFKDFKAYPMFHFIETPAQETKWNEINVKGVNAPKASKSEYRCPFDTKEDFAVEIANLGKQVTVYTDATKVTVVDSKNYTVGENVLSFKKEYIQSLGKGQYPFFVVAEKGSEIVNVTLYDPAESLQAPVTDKTVYYYVMEGTAEDLKISIDMKNGQFERVSGAGITSKYYTFTAGENGSTVGTITIDKDWMAKQFKGDKDYKFTVKSVNPLNEEESVTTTFTISAVYEIPTDPDVPVDPDIPENPDKPTEPEKPQDEEKGGCGSVVWTSLAGIGAIITATAVILMAVQKNKEGRSTK